MTRASPRDIQSPRESGNSESSRGISLGWDGSRYCLRRETSRTLSINGYHRETLTALKPTLEGGKVPLLIFVNKGIEIKTRALTLEIIADTCGPDIAKIATFLVSSLARPCFSTLNAHP